MAALLATAACLAASALAQFVPAPTDLTTLEGYAGISIRYKEVPTGICELDASVRSYSGYADVGLNEHLFFWFFEARTVDPLTAPLTVWINGGPGSSSMIGLFQELGPCRINSDGTVENNPYSFSEVSNMLFVDEPVTVGFSYSEAVSGYVDDDSGSGYIVQLPDATCPDYPAASGNCGTYSYSNESLTANTTANAAPNMWKLLQGFMGAFPQYSRDGFHFTTESYGGHYGPIFNEYFKQQNKVNPKGSKKINLQSVSIGNGWYDPPIQYQAYYNFTVYPGNTYDYFPYDAALENQVYNALYGEGNCLDQEIACRESGIDEICAAADNFCYYEVEAALDIYPERDEYDIRELQPDPFPPEFFVEYLNTPAVQAAIGAYTNYTEFSYTVGNAFGSTGDDSREDGTIEAVGKLLNQNVRVTMYAGDADYNCNWLGGQVVAHEVGAKGFEKAGFTNVSTSDGVVHGQVKQSGNFSFVRIYESGHEVPFYQPVIALEMFERIITGKDIATGNVTVTPSYKTVGTAESTYREGISTVQFSVVPTDDTYNTTTNMPNPYNASTADAKTSVAAAAGAKEARAAAKARNAKRWRPGKKL